MQENGFESRRVGIQVIARAADILRTLKTNPTGMSLGQIAEVVGLPRSTVQRIVAALQTERMVIADAGGGGFRLGPELNALAEATRYNIVESCRLFLTELAQATGETADLSVLRGSSMIFLDQVPGMHRLRTISSVGETFPLSTTANGRSCLSQLAPDQAERLVAEEWGRRAISGDIAGFMETLQSVRKIGLAFDLDEHTEGISAVGFAFRDWMGELHSISVPVPSTRFADRRSDIVDAIGITAENVRKMMRQGYE